MNVREVNQCDDVVAQCREKILRLFLLLINESVNFIPKSVGLVSGYVSINNVYAAD
jgi:hypothetical protein